MGQPKLSTIKRLFVLSGNQCAFPSCEASIVHESGKVTGRICHIKARNPGGPRYDSTQTEDERHGFENLILMCPEHHDVIDTDVQTYTVERLVEMKHSHESEIKPVESSNEIAQQLINSISIEGNEGIAIISQNQSGGQTAFSITNNLYSNTKPVKAYIRLFREDINKTTKELKEIRAIGGGIVDLKPTLIDNWEEKFSLIVDSLTAEESSVLIQYYSRIIRFQDFLYEVQKYIKEKNIKPGFPYYHAVFNSYVKAYYNFINEILDIDLSNLLKKLTELSQ